MKTIVKLIALFVAITGIAAAEADKLPEQKEVAGLKVEDVAGDYRYFGRDYALTKGGLVRKGENASTDFEAWRFVELNGKPAVQLRQRVGNKTEWTRPFIIGGKELVKKN